MVEGLSQFRWSLPEDHPRDYREWAKEYVADERRIETQIDVSQEVQVATGRRFATVRCLTDYHSPLLLGNGEDGRCPAGYYPQVVDALLTLFVR